MKPTLKKKVSRSQVQKKGGIDSFIAKELKSISSKPAPSPKPDFKSPLSNPQKMTSQVTIYPRPEDGSERPIAFQKPPKIIHSINKDALPKSSKPFTISKGLLKKVDYKPPGSSGSSARGDDPELAAKRSSQEPLFNTPISRGKQGFSTLQVPEETKSYQKPRLLIKKHERENSNSTGKSLSPSPSTENKLPKKVVKATAGPSLLIKGATPLANRNPSLSKFDKKPAQQDPEQEEGYGDSDFQDFEAEEAGGEKKEMILNKIAKIMKRENEQAAHFERGLQDIQKSGGSKRAPFSEGKIEMGRGITVGAKKTVSHGKVNAQKERTRDLKKIIDLGQSDFQDLFNIDPSSAHQRLYNKISAGEVKHQVIQTQFSLNEEAQTQEIDFVNEGNQCPEDKHETKSKMFNKTNIIQTNALDRWNQISTDAVALSHFLQRAEPLIMTLLDENQISEKKKEEEKQKKPFEVKSKLRLPSSLLKQLGLPDDAPHTISMAQVLPYGQGDVAVSYEIPLSDQQVKSDAVFFCDNPIYVIVIYSSHSSLAKRALYSSGKPTALITPQEYLMVVGTKVGGIALYDLLDAATLSDFVPGVINQEDNPLPKEQRIQFKNPCFMTDSLLEIGHGGAVVDLKVTHTLAGSQIASLDQYGKLAMWSVVELLSTRDQGGSVVDLTLSPGSRFKLVKNDEVSLRHKFHHQISPVTGFQLSNHDPMQVGVMGQAGLRHREATLQRSGVTQDALEMETHCQGTQSKITTLDLSGDGHILVGYSCGTVALFHRDFTSALTSWYYVCEASVQQVRWSEFFFPGVQGSSESTRFAIENRLSEFYVLDSNWVLYIWALGKNVTVRRSYDSQRSVREINFKEQLSGIAPTIQDIRNTSYDQAFYCCFATTEQKTEVRVRNDRSFKKSTKVKQGQIQAENKKIARVFTRLPPNSTDV